LSQRDSGYARKERDLYETPEWVTRALLPHLRENRCTWEPACGSGAMAKVLVSRGAVICSDIEPNLDGAARKDFLFEPWGAFRDHSVDAVITNPPYELAQEFIEHALRMVEPVRGFVAMILRTDFDHAKSRSHLFRDCPAFAKKLVLMKRIVWFAEENGKPKASPSFNHAWYVWDWRHDGAPSIAYGP
jgi:hypothetical protein